MKLGNSKIGEIIFEKILENNPLQNCVLSPFSIEILIAMLLNATEGKVFEELEKMISISKSELEDYNYSLKEQIEKVKSNMVKDKIKIASSFWFREDFELAGNKFYIIADYLKILQENFDAECSETTLSEIQYKINEWVSKATKGLIKEIKVPDDPDLLAVIVNVIYFKAKWFDLFSEKREQEEFTLFNGKKVMANYITKGDIYGGVQLSYYEDEILQAVRIPYFDRNFAMEIYLPKAYNDLPQVLEIITKNDFNHYIDKFEVVNNLAVKIPKFSIEREIPIKDLLINLGVKKAFEWSHDFGKLTNCPLVKISEMNQKINLKVTKFGTKAVAISSMITSGGLGVPSYKEQEVIQFYATRPFLFMIRHLATKQVIFIGTLFNPENQ